jgi:hypothetical protein
VGSDGGRQAPASTGQRLIWLMERRGGANGALNILIAFRLRGPLRDRALLGALREIVVRHESLRTTFQGRGPGLTQVVRPPDPMPDGVITSADIPESELRGAVLAEAHHRFDLGAEWPCRIRLFRIAQEDHVLTISVHHIATDGWSMGVLMEELQALYAVDLGYRAELPELPAWQQVDFALWQQQCSEDGSLDGKVAYWREALGAGQPVSLPSILGLSSADREHEPGIVQYEIPGEICSLIRQAARQCHSTAFAVLFAALAGYLAVCGGEPSLVVPVFFANRRSKHLYRTVGYIANLVLVPIDLTDQPPFPELARRAKRALANAIANQEVPYHVVPPPDGGSERRRHPELVVEYQNIAGSGTLELAELEVEPYDLDATPGTRFAVELHFVGRDDGLKVVCVYSADHTCASAVVRFLDGFVAYAERLEL